MRTAAALGLGDVFLHGNGAGWFDGPHAARREARAAARRHKNPLRVRRAIPEFTDGFREIVLVAPHGPGRALGRERLARGRDQLVVIGLAPGPVQAAAPGRVRVATLNLEPVAEAGGGHWSAACHRHDAWPALARERAAVAAPR